jgi:hypothetical protein
VNLPKETHAHKVVTDFDSANPRRPSHPGWALGRRSINTLPQSRAAKVWRFIGQLALVGLREGLFLGYWVPWTQFLHLA